MDRTLRTQTREAVEGMVYPERDLTTLTTLRFPFSATALSRVCSLGVTKCKGPSALKQVPWDSE